MVALDEFVLRVGIKLIEIDRWTTEGLIIDSFMKRGAILAQQLLNLLRNSGCACHAGGLDSRCLDKAGNTCGAADKKIVKAFDDGTSSGKGTDHEQIADAKKWAEGDEGAADAGYAFDADALATAATKRRDDAVAAKKAEEEAAKRAEEDRQARTIDTDYFTMVLPDWFPIEEFEYSTQEGSDYGCGTGDWSVTNFIRNGDANDNADFKIVTYEQGMPAYGCGYAKELGTSKGRTVQLLVGGVTAQGALGMSLGDYGDALAACITLK